MRRMSKIDFGAVPHLNFAEVLNVKQKENMRRISEIAYEIKREWKKVYFGAVPYLDALTCLETIEDKYGMEDARGLIAYFLSNATSFRGEKAKALKAELKAIAGIK